MNLFDKLFIGAYNFFHQRGRKDARFSAVAALCAIEFCSIIMPLMFLKVIYQSTLLSSFFTGNKFMYLPIPVIWFAAVYFFYTKEKTERLFAKYMEMPSRDKHLWNYAHLVILIFWCVFMFFLIYLNKHIQRN